MTGTRVIKRQIRTGTYNPVTMRIDCTKTNWVVRCANGTFPAFTTRALAREFAREIK